MEDLQSISEVIRAKERELQKIQELRFSQLEKTIDERDKVLAESNQRFEKLKDDFQYNLRLIEARDKEIKRLEGIIDKQAKLNEELERENKVLNNKVETLQQREKERVDKFEQDKVMNKVSYFLFLFLFTRIFILIIIIIVAHSQ
jgi:uncharacterized protein (DUF3084 family)